MRPTLLILCCGGGDCRDRDPLLPRSPLESRMAGAVLPVTCGRPVC